MKNDIRRFLVLVISSLLMTTHVFSFSNDADAIPDIELPSNWKKVPDVAQYKLSDWNNVIGKAKGVTLFEAKLIADSDDRITYFFFVKDYQLALENVTVEPNIWRIFNKGDAVFFTGKPRWGSSPSSDGYIKIKY